MKNQYFGDVNDYFKYGLLRALTGNGALPTAVCWMLTPDDTSSDGLHISYLQKPQEWRPYDAELYDRLREAVMTQRCRNVRYAVDADLVPGARFYDSLLSDDRAERAAYWSSLWEVTKRHLFSAPFGLSPSQF